MTPVATHKYLWRLLWIGLVLTPHFVGAQVSTQVEEEAWRKAVSQDSLNGYAEYLLAYPESNRKAAIRNAATRLMQAAVEKEVSKGALVSRRGILETDDLPIEGWVGETATISLAGGELRLSNDFLILTDPTDSFVFTGKVYTWRPLAVTIVKSGRGVVVQYRPRETWVFVFDVDVSSIVKTWYQWKKTPQVR